MELNGGKPISLSPEQRRKLAEKVKEVDPEVLKRITAADFEGFDPQNPDGTMNVALPMPVSARSCTVKTEHHSPMIAVRQTDASR